MITGETQETYCKAKETYYIARETYYMAKETYYMAKRPIGGLGTNDNRREIESKYGLEMGLGFRV